MDYFSFITTSTTNRAEGKNERESNNGVKEELFQIINRWGD